MRKKPNLDVNFEKHGKVMGFSFFNKEVSGIRV
jgi:uncharacterized protein YuzE